MSNLTTAERRRWAEDMRARWQGTDYQAKAEAHAARMIAAADLEDLEAGRELVTADSAAMIYDYPIIGIYTITGGGDATCGRPYGDAEADRAEASGIYTAWEWCHDPAAEERAGELIRLYIGSTERGPEAQYNCHDKQWYKLTSKGNFGKKYACGGNWRGEKCTGDETPEIYKKLMEVLGMDQQKKIEAAKARLAAAEKRVFAAHQREGAAAYYRQASQPAYPGQETTCANKGAIVEALAAKTEAEADLIEAEAGL